MHTTTYFIAGKVFSALGVADPARMWLGHAIPSQFRGVLPPRPAPLLRGHQEGSQVLTQSLFAILCASVNTASPHPTFRSRFRMLPLDTFLTRGAAHLALKYARHNQNIL